MILTEDTKRRLLEDYNDHSKPTREIAEKYGIDRTTLARIAVEMGATPRRPNAYGKRGGGKNTVCPKCHKTIDVKGARFCCFCGSDIRTEKEILCEKIEKVISYVRFLPENMRDETRDVMLAAIKEIKG